MTATSIYSEASVLGSVSRGRIDGPWKLRVGDLVKMKQPPRDIWEALLVVAKIDADGVHVLNADEGDGTIVPASRLGLAVTAALSPQLNLRSAKGTDAQSNQSKGGRKNE